MSQPPRIGGVLEAALYVDDLPRAVEFYRDLLGLEMIVHQPPRHAFFRCGSTIVLLFVAAHSRMPPAKGALPVPPHGAQGQGHLCFAAPNGDLAAWADYLRGQGVTIESEVTWPHGPKSIYLRDPAGNSLEFADPNLWDAAP